MDLLVKMESGIAPDPSYRGQGEFMHAVFRRLENFARYGGDAPPGSASGSVVAPASIGRQAISDMYKELHRRMEEDASKVGFSDLNELMRFKWLLSGEQVARLQSWTDTILDGMARR